MKARDIMTSSVITVSPESTIQEIARLLHGNRISGVPVVNNENEVIGIITEGDLIIKIAKPHLPAHIELLGGIIYLRRPQEMDDELKKITAALAKDIMTEKVITVEENCDIEDIASLMVNRKINHLPVVRDRKLIGIITRGDVIETLAGEAAPLDENIPDAT